MIFCARSRIARYCDRLVFEINVTYLQPFGVSLACSHVGQTLTEIGGIDGGPFATSTSHIMQDGGKLFRARNLGHVLGRLAPRNICDRILQQETLTHRVFTNLAQAPTVPVECARGALGGASNGPSLHHVSGDIGNGHMAEILGQLLDRVLLSVDHGWFPVELGQIEPAFGQPPDELTVLVIFSKGQVEAVVGRETLDLVGEIAETAAGERGVVSFQTSLELLAMGFDYGVQEAGSAGAIEVVRDAVQFLLSTFDRLFHDDGAGNYTQTRRVFLAGDNGGLQQDLSARHACRILLRFNTVAR